MLSFSHPDYIIAPVLIPYIYENDLEDIDDIYLKEIDDDGESLGVRTFNVARYTAKSIKSKYY